MGGGWRGGGGVGGGGTENGIPLGDPPNSIFKGVVIYRKSSHC